MEMLSAFTDVLHVSNLTKANHFQGVLKSYQLFDPKEIASILQKLEKYSISIGIKKLLGLLDMIKQMGAQNRVSKFLSKLENEGFITPKFDSTV